MNPNYECCTFRGSLVALDAATGSLLWKTYTISAEAKPIGKNPAGTTRWGPSGGGVWSSPTVDVKRKVVYAATGNMYTEPQQPTSDAIMAFDLDTGAVKWTSQVTRRTFSSSAAAGAQNGANCPPAEDLGPDFDFGNAPILVKRPDGTRHDRRRPEIGRRLGVRSRQEGRRALAVPRRKGQRARRPGVRIRGRRRRRRTSPSPTCSAARPAVCTR